MANTLGRDEFGNIVEVNPEDLARAGSVKRATAEDIAQFEHKKATKKVGLESALQASRDMPLAAQMGMARGLTFGLSDEVVALDPGTRREMLRVKEDNPFSSMGGEFLSMVTPGSIGAGLAKGGSAIAKGIAGKTPGIARSAFAHGVGGAMENAAWGAQQAISESALGDTKLTGEKLLQHMGLGAAIGGAFGVVGGGLVGAIGKTKRGMTTLLDKAGGGEALSDKTFGSLVKGEGPSKVGKFHKVLNPSADEAFIIAAEVKAGVRKGTKEQEELGERLFRYTDEAERGKAIDNRAYAASAAVDDFLIAGQRFDEALNFKDKQGLHGKLIDKEMAREMAGGVSEHFDNFVIPELEKVAGSGSFRAGSAAGAKGKNQFRLVIDEMLGPFERHVDSAGNVYMERNLAAGLMRTSPEKAFAKLNELDDLLAHSVKRLKGSPGSGTAELAIRNARDEVRALLTADSVWGTKAVAAQRDLVEAAAAVAAAKKPFKDAFMRSGGIEAADAGKMRGWLNDVDSPLGKQRHEDIDRYLAAREAQAEVVSRHLKPTGETADALERLAGARAGVNEQAMLARRDAEEFAGAKVFKAGGGNYGLSLAGFAAASFVGLPGLLGAFGTDVATRYPMYLRRMANVRKMVADTDNRILGGVKDLFKASKPQAMPGLIARATDKAGSAARSGGRGIRNAAVVGGHKLLEQYNDAVEAISQPDDVVVANAQQSMGELQEAAPESTAQATAQTLAAVHYLRSQLPQTSSDLLPVNPNWATKPTPSLEAVQKFMDKVRVVSDPISILDEAKKGTLTKDMVSAVENVYPELVADIRTKILQAAAESPTPPSYSTAVSLSVVFSVAATPQMRSAYVIKQQQAYGARAAPAPPKAKSSMGMTGVTKDGMGGDGASMSARLDGPLDNRM